MDVLVYIFCANEGKGINKWYRNNCNAVGLQVIKIILASNAS